MKPEDLIRSVAPHIGDNYESLDDYSMVVNNFPNGDTVIVREKITKSISVRYVFGYSDGNFSDFHCFFKKL